MKVATTYGDSHRTARGRQLRQRRCENPWSVPGAAPVPPSPFAAPAQVTPAGARRCTAWSRVRMAPARVPSSRWEAVIVDHHWLAAEPWRRPGGIPAPAIMSVTSATRSVPLARTAVQTRRVTLNAFSNQPDRDPLISQCGADRAGATSRTAHGVVEVASPSPPQRRTPTRNSTRAWRLCARTHLTPRSCSRRIRVSAPRQLGSPGVISRSSGNSRSSSKRSLLASSIALSGCAPSKSERETVLPGKVPGPALRARVEEPPPSRRKRRGKSPPSMR